jgi:hypothetical protein
LVDDVNIRNFDDYSIIVKTVGRVEFNKNDWKLSKCMCFNFQKKYICEHTLGLAIRLELITPPAHTVDLALQKKAKRGRKSKAKGGKALIID